MRAGIPAPVSALEKREVVPLHAGDRATRLVERCAWVAIPLVCAVHLWLYRFEMVNLDGISYLDVASAWREGRWSDAINAYWSPMYSWALAFAFAAVSPTPYWEYPLVHAVNGLITLGAVAAFAYLLRSLRMRDASPMPAPVFTAFGYALFLWAALTLLVVWMESPDLFAAAFVFMASGALVRISRGDRRPRLFVLFGASLGAAYLTKAAMLPIAAVFLMSALLVGGRRAARGVALAGLTLLIVAGPWIAVLSASRGRFTTGESGPLNYIWFVNGSENWPHNWPPHWPHVRGHSGAGAPAHPVRELSSDPVVYEFRAPIAGTYPMWYEPSWWYEGVRPYFDLRDQVRRLLVSAGDLYRLFALSPYNFQFFSPQPAMLAALLVVLIALDRAPRRRVFRSPLALWLVPTGAVGMYALVYVEPRYLGAFVVVAWLLAVDALRPTDSPAERRVLRAGGIAMVTVLLGASLVATWQEVYPAVQAARWGAGRQHRSWVAMERLQAAGLQQDEAVAVAGNAQAATRWARLARVRIVAEVPSAETWKLQADGPEGDAARAAALDAFTRAGALWALLEKPTGDPPAGWRRVEDTPYVLRRLNQ